MQTRLNIFRLFSQTWGHHSFFDLSFSYANWCETLWSPWYINPKSVQYVIKIDCFQALSITYNKVTRLVQSPLVMAGSKIATATVLRVSTVRVYITILWPEGRRNKIINIIENHLMIYYLGKLTNKQKEF